MALEHARRADVDVVLLQRGEAVGMELMNVDDIRSARQEKS